jgi:hypothetical protein
MDGKGKRKSLAIRDEINILVYVDAHIGTHVEQASLLRLPVPTLNPTVKKHEETERSSIKCEPFSKQRKSSKCSLLEELESVLAVWFKQACESNAPIDGTHLKEKGLHISACLEIVVGLADLRGSTTLCTEICQVRAGVLIEKLLLLQEIEGCDLCNINNAEEIGLFFSLQPSKTLTFYEEFCQGGTKSKQWVTVLLACNHSRNW